MKISFYVIASIFFIGLPALMTAADKEVPQPTHGFEAQVADREKTRQQILAVLRSQFGLQTETVNVPCDE